MNAIIAAIHGILTGQTDPSWPDRFDAWLCEHDPEVRLLKKEYAAGPFPRWNCLVRDPRLARALANEIELLAVAARECRQTPSERTTHFSPPIWLVAHSNGAVIALLVTKRLIARGCRVGGVLLIGAACEADVSRNGVLDWVMCGQLGAAIAYSSEADRVVDCDWRGETGWARVRAWIWRRLIWPYGGLGHSGWRLNEYPFPDHEQERITRGPLVFTRWYRGGHSSYFEPQNEADTFEQIYSDILQATLAIQEQEQDRESERKKLNADCALHALALAHALNLGKKDQLQGSSEEHEQEQD